MCGTTLENAPSFTLMSHRCPTKRHPLLGARSTPGLVPRPVLFFASLVFLTRRLLGESGSHVGHMPSDTVLSCIVVNGSRSNLDHLVINGAWFDPCLSSYV